MQAMSRRAPIGVLLDSIQSWLFPVLEDELGELDDKHRQFVAVCELYAPQDHMAGYQWCGNGCPPSDRLALCKAFIAKAVWDFATTRDLIDAIRHRPVWRRLCGGEALGQVPSESTFSRAFDPFSSDNRLQAIHEALIKTHYGEKIAGHISRDATAIHAPRKGHGEAAGEDRPEQKGVLVRLQAASGRDRRGYSGQRDPHLGQPARQSGRHSPGADECRADRQPLRSGRCRVRRQGNPRDVRSPRACADYRRLTTDQPRLHQKPRF